MTHPRPASNPRYWRSESLAKARERSARPMDSRDSNVAKWRRHDVVESLPLDTSPTLINGQRSCRFQHRRLVAMHHFDLGSLILVTIASTPDCALPRLCP